LKLECLLELSPSFHNWLLKERIEYHLGSEAGGKAGRCCTAQTVILRCEHAF
jgi:hypothetical protein